MARATKRFSFVRFSLRSLFILTTAICIFLGYQWEWVKRRRAFLAEQTRLFAADTMPGRNHYWWMLEGGNAPQLLWMFNEPGYHRLSIIVEDGFTKHDGAFYTMPRTHPTRVRAKSLFPEAEIIGSYADRRPEGKELQPIVIE
jgi:hypothetical protein